MKRALPLLLLGLSAACGLDGTHPGVESAPEVLGQALCPGGTMIQGVDVSSYQGGSINWGQAKGSGIEWAYAKATEGGGSGCGWNYQDPTFPGNWSGTANAGVLRGAYHFFHPSCNGTAQADFYLGYVGALGAGDLPPMLDWEVSDGVSGSTASASAQAFINEIKAKTGKQTVIYTSPGLWSGFGASGFGNNPLWVADYVNYTDTACPALPSGWSSFDFWQYSDGTHGTPSVPGIGACDRDIFNGSLAQLQGLAGAQATLPIGQQSGNDAITLVNWPDQHMDVFAKTPAGEMEHANTTAAGDAWTAFASLDQGADCGSAASFWGDPWVYPELFSPLASGGSGHLWYTSGKGWNTFQSYGGSNLSHFATLVWLDGRTEVFALGKDNAIWHDYWDTATTAWSGWASLGGSFATGPGTILWASGTGELFAVDAAGDIWHSWSGSGASYPNGWYAWTKFGSGMASRPSPVRWADGHAEVFVRGADGQLYHSDFDATNGWPAFSALSKGDLIIGEPSAIMDDGKGGGTGPEVFARDASGQVVHLWWNGSAYTSFTALGTEVAASDPFGWIRGDGAAEVFAVDTQGDLVRNYRDPKTSWGGWGSIGSGFDACAPALPPPLEDGGVTPDAGEDGGVKAPDAGSCPGAPECTRPDGGAADAGAPEDAGQPEDAGGESLGGAGPDAGDAASVLAAQGCNCGSAGGDASFLFLAACGLLARRRRR
ncbi:MAG: GH25 family lysozyme [Myxococcales bacterium]